MKTVKTLKIETNQFFLFKNENNIKIENLIFSDYPSENNMKKFYFNNLYLFIKNEIIDHCIKILSLIKDLLSEEQIKKIIDMIINSKKYIYYSSFCLNVLKSRATESDLITKEEGKKIENEILKNNMNALNYSQIIIKGRWKELEENLIKEKNKDIMALIFYSIYVLKDRWINIKDIDPKITHELEKKIFEKFDPNNTKINPEIPHHSFFSEYILLDDKRILEIEDKIFNSNYNGKINYIEKKIGGRFPESEPFIVKNHNDSIQYAERILKKPWNQVKGIDDKIVKAAEKIISDNFNNRVSYAIFSKKRLNDKFEKILFYNLDTNLTYEYIDELIKDRVPEFEEALDIITKNFQDDMIKSKKIYRGDTLLKYDDEIEDEEYFIQTQKENAFHAGSEYINQYMNGDWPEFFEREEEFFGNM